MRIVVVLWILSLALPAYAEDGTEITKVIGAEFPGKYKHPASITELDNGDLYVAYYGGDGEYEDDSKVWGLRRPAGQSDWTTAGVIADTPFRAEGNPVVWQAPGGVVWLFYVQHYGETWSESRIKAKISSDGARTWSDSFMVAFEQGMMVRSESRDGGRTWSRGEDSEFPNPNAAADFIKLQNGHLMLAYNHSMNDRTPLTVAISEDNDESYPHRRHIGEGENSFAYPTAIQTRDGRLHVLYTTNQRSTVMLASFEESAILGHALPTVR